MTHSLFTWSDTGQLAKDGFRALPRGTMPSYPDLACFTVCDYAFPCFTVCHFSPFHIEQKQHGGWEGMEKN